MSENLFTYMKLDELASSGRMDTPIWVQFVDSCNAVVAILDWSPDKNFIAVLGVDWTEVAGNYGITWFAWKLPPTAQEKELMHNLSCPPTRRRNDEYAAIARKLLGIDEGYSGRKR